VVAAADGAKLVARLGAKAIPLVASRDGVPGGMVEQAWPVGASFARFERPMPNEMVR